MKVFSSRPKNLAFFLHRIINPLFDPIYFARGVYGYVWFIRDYLSFSKLNKKTPNIGDLYPCLHDKTTLTPFDAHYFFQQLWVFENVLLNKPEKHVDIGSTYQMSGFLSKIVPTEFVDIRPINCNLNNMKVVNGSIMELPYETSSLESLSCLNVIEHIGLGRYGDPLDPLGMDKACQELSRVLGKGGILYLSVPIGKERLCFNAHRVSSPHKIIKNMENLALESFSAVNDDGKFVADTDPQLYENSSYSLGLFKFMKI